LGSLGFLVESAAIRQQASREQEAGSTKCPTVREAGNRFAVIGRDSAEPSWPTRGRQCALAWKLFDRS